MIVPQVAPERYDNFARALHWLMAVLVIGTLIVAETRDWFPARQQRPPALRQRPQSDRRRDFHPRVDPPGVAAALDRACDHAAAAVLAADVFVSVTSAG